MRNKVVLVMLALGLALSLTISFAQNEPVALRLAVSDKQGRPSEPYVLEFIQQVETLSDNTITVACTSSTGSTSECLAAVLPRERYNPVPRPAAPHPA